MHDKQDQTMTYKMYYVFVTRYLQVFTAYYQVLNYHILVIIVNQCSHIIIVVEAALPPPVSMLLTFKYTQRSFYTGHSGGNDIGLLLTSGSMTS